MNTVFSLLLFHQEIKTSDSRRIWGSSRRRCNSPFSTSLPVICNVFCKSFSRADINKMILSCRSCCQQMALKHINITMLVILICFAKKPSNIPHSYEYPTFLLILHKHMNITILMNISQSY